MSHAMILGEKHSRQKEQQEFMPRNEVRQSEKEKEDEGSLIRVSEGQAATRWG